MNRGKVWLRCSDTIFDFNGIKIPPKNPLTKYELKVKTKAHAKSSILGKEELHNKVAMHRLK